MRPERDNQFATVKRQLQDRPLSIDMWLQKSVLLDI
jgi:hypothetical protein